MGNNANIAAFARNTDGSSIQLGGSGATNQLSYYEEGTWTPTIENGTVNVARSRYFRVGNLVTIACTMTIDSISGSNNFRVQNLPFVPNMTDDVEWHGPVMMNFVNFTNTYQTLIAYLYTGSTTPRVEFYGTGDNVIWDAVGANEIAVSSSIQFTIQYHTS